MRCAWLGASALLLAAYADAARIDEQRAAFPDAYARAELGDRNVLHEYDALLSDYVLWPDLRAAYLRSRLHEADPDEVRAFIASHATLKPARALRYRYAVHLAASGRPREYLEMYAAHYADLGIEQLDCLALDARRAIGSTDGLLDAARPLWLVGYSQVDACDPVFEYLRQSGQLDAALYRERFALAIDARSLSLARYLARSLPDEFRRRAAAWTDAYGQPRAFLAHHERARDSQEYRAQLAAAVESLAYDEPAAAAAAWDAIADQYAFTDAERHHAARHVALWLARHHDAQGEARLAALPAPAVDTEVLRWHVRNALARLDWTAVLAGVERLPPDEAASQQWRYWRGIALRRSGRYADGTLLLDDLAGERSYYGFLAADELGRDYAWSHEALVADDAVLAELARMPQFVRARELFLVGLEGRGRSEWDSAVALLVPRQQAQAAVLAHRWGWHSRAIATAASLDRYDDLLLRYPMPYADAFEQYSAAAGIRPSWAYGIARSESLFMRDIRSPAGALGVMQLTPATGRHTARALQAPYAGRVTLMDADSNIRLGTGYLGAMYERFGRNRVLATAAYNAGPLRVERWLPDAGDIDSRIWVERIPYQETRDYVRRVLAAETIFHWRMAGEMRRLSQDMGPVAARPKVARR